MAIDKNSKAYQSLLNSGYSDQQISDMYNKASSGQSRQEVVKDTTPINPAKSQATASNVDRSWDQGNGNYVYNSSTGYYEKEGTARATQTTPEVKQETPIKQQETTVSTVPEIKQEGVLKPLSQDYYNQTGDDAQNKIISNLNNYRQTNPEYFRDYESFKKNFSYDARNDEQKQTLDSWYGGYQKGMELAGIPVTDLYTQYKDGQVSMNELENLRVYDPTKYAELQNQINKGNIIAAYDDDKGVDTTGMNLQDMAYNAAMQMFTKFMSGDSSSGASQYFRDYEEKMESPEMLALSDQCTEVQEQMENIQSDLDSIKKSVEAEYEGTGATRSKINAIIADRSYDLQLQLRTLNSEYNKYATQYNNRMQQYQNEFNMQIQEYQINQQARQQQMQELGFAMDLMNFETNDQKQQREWDYWVKQQEYTNGNINSKDYDTRYKAALKSVQNLLSQYDGIPMQRSAEQMAQDVLKAIDNGSDLGAELTKINKQIQGKPEYKKLYNATFGGSQGFGQTVSIGGTDYVEYNGKLYTADEFNKQFGNAKGKANYTVVSEDVLKTYSDGRAGTFGSFMANSKYNDGNYIGQCGKFVNDYLQEIGAGRPFGSETIDVRKQWVNSDEGKVGTVAVFDYNHYIDGKNYGHVGIVVSAPDKNGDFWVKDANFDSDGKVQTRKVNLKDVSLKGFIDPTLDQNGKRGTVGESATATTTTTTTSSKGDTKTTKTTTTETTAEDTRTKAAAMLKQIKTGNMTPSETSNARDWLIENGYGEEFLEALDKGIKVSLTDTQQDFYEYGMNTYKNSDIVKDFKEASTQISNLITSLNANNGVGDLAGIFQFMKVLDPSSVVREGEFKQAAKSAGYANPEALWQNYVKHGWDGTWLTEAQRGNFKELAKSLIKSQAEMYDIEYGDLKKVFENANIDEQWLPTNYAEVIINKLDGKTATGTTESTNFYTKYANTAPGTGKKRPFGSNQNKVTLSDGQSFDW